jgi:hypothetical protein
MAALAAAFLVASCSGSGVASGPSGTAGAAAMAGGSAAIPGGAGGPTPTVRSSIGPGTTASGPTPRPGTPTGGSPTSTAGGPTPSSALVVATVARWHLPFAVSREVAVVDGGALIVLGGLDRTGASSAAVIGVDPADGRTRMLGSLAVPTHDAGGVLLGGTVLLLGGGRSVATATTESFTPAGSGSASDGLPTGGRSAVVGRLPAPRADLAVAQAGEGAFVVGGWDGRTALAPVLETTDGITTRVVGTLPQAVRYPAVAAVAGSIWVFGGQRNGRAIDTIQRVELASGHASVAGHLPSPISDSAAVILGGSVYLLGGRSGGSPTDRIWRFDPATGAVVAAGMLPYPVADGAVAVVGEVAYLVGGEGRRPLDTSIEVRIASG